MGLRGHADAGAAVAHLGGQRGIHLRHHRAVAFGRIQPRQKQRHQQRPHQRHAGGPIGYRLAAADMFAGNRPQPHRRKRERHHHGHNADVGRVIRAEIGAALGEFGRPAIVHRKKAQPQKHRQQAESHNAEPIDKSRRTAPQAIEPRRAKQSQRRQQPQQIILIAAGAGRQQQKSHRQPRKRQHAPALLMKLDAAGRPQSQRPRRKGKPE